VQAQVDRFLRYLQDEQGCSENTIAAYRNDLRQFVTFIDPVAAGSTGSWGDVDRQLIERYGGFINERNYAPSTIARKIASIKSFFSYLLDSGLLKENPTIVLDAPKVEKPLPHIMSVEEIEQLLAEPAKRTTPKALRDRALLDLLYATGMRVSEVITLRLSDVDMTGEHVLCVGRDGNTRQLPLTTRALESLSAYLEKGREALVQDRAETMLFVNQRGHPLTRQGLWLIIKAYAEAAGLGPDITPHTLRHSFAAHRLAGGARLQEVRELLGHANISTTQVYMDVADPSGE
jgi:integrase/recombinase XerD